MMKAATASRRLGLNSSVSFPGALAWPYLYPWPQRPRGLIDEAFDELARRWRPILDAYDAAGVDICFEIHPGEDLLAGSEYRVTVSELLDVHGVALAESSFVFTTAARPTEEDAGGGTGPFGRHVGHHGHGQYDLTPPGQPSELDERGDQPIADGGTE